jgi:hypothetical protein
MIDIVIDTENIVEDSGVITRVDYQGISNVIKVIRTDGYTYYIATPDRDLYQILLVDNLPEDYEPDGYYYIDGEWIKRDIPSPTGDTENYIIF